MLVALCLLGVSSAASFPRAGSLDPSFGNGGVVTQPGTGIKGIAVQPDGKIVVAGGAVLARYLPNGSPDPSFGNGGYVQATSAQALALQPDGKIVVVGTHPLAGPAVYGEFLIARYTPNGSPDTSFGTDGVTTTNTFATCDYGYCGSGASTVAILPDGQILAAGTAMAENEWGGCCDDFFVFVRYTSAGSVEPNFGKGGILQTGGAARLEGIAVLPSGKILASGAGYFDDHGEYSVWMDVTRFLPDGSIDTSFGTNGGAFTPPELGYCGGPFALQQEKIVVAGTTCQANDRSNVHPVLARYDANGRLDRSFGKHGFAEVGRVSNSGRPVVAAQRDGKILVAAGSSLVRLLPDGRLDTNFGARGVVTLGGAVSTLALQRDGKILVGGGTLARLIAWRPTCVVPRVSGETIADATAALEKAHCSRGSIGWYPSSTVPHGRAIYTVPARGTRHPAGSTVELVVSSG